MIKNLNSSDEPIGACVIVLDKDRQKVMIGKRKNSYRSGYYGLPGGRVQRPESLEDCAIRELLEETRLKVSGLKYLGVVRDLQEDNTFIHFVFLCENYQGEPKVAEPDKCEGWEWIEPENIPEKTLPGHKAAVDLFMKSGKANYREISSL